MQGNAALDGTSTSSCFLQEWLDVGDLPSVQLLEEIFPKWSWKVIISREFNKLTKIIMFSVAEWNDILLTYRNSWDKCLPGSRSFTPIECSYLMVALDLPTI